MNVAYVRLKNLQIGYNLPQSLIADLGLANARVYMTGENLWSWSPLYRTANNVDIEAITSPSDQLFTGSNSGDGDRKSTRLNSSHVAISYAVFCLKKKMHE